MSHTYRFEDGLLVIKVSGECYIEELKSAILEAFADPDFCSGIFPLIDIREVASLPSASTEIQDFVRFFGTVKEKLSPRMAFVVNSLGHYGVARMLSTYAHLRNNQDIKVFYNIDEARRWLSSQLVRLDHTTTPKSVRAGKS